MSTSAVQYRTMQAIQTLICGLSLDGLDDAHVVLRWFLTDRDLALPAVVIAPAGGIPQTTGTNVKDDWVRAIDVGIYAAIEQDMTTGLADYLLWEEEITRALNNRRLSSVDENYTVTVGPHPALLWLHYQSNTLATAFSVRPVSREARS